MKNTNKRVLLIAVAALLLTVAVSGTLAYLVDVTGQVVNTFEPSEVKCAVIEDGWTPGSTVKEDVVIKNTGDIDAYIRAAIVVTWQDANGNVYGIPPVEGTDYSLSIGEDWQEDGGFYYYNSSVIPEASTTELIDRCEVKTAAPDSEYSLHVEILAQAIQAEGMGVDNAVDAFAKALAGN